MKSVHAVMKNSGKLLMVFDNQADAEEMAFSLQEEMAYYWYCLDIHMGKTTQEYFADERQRKNTKRRRKMSLECAILLSGLICEAYTVRETILFE